jgi:hypothetical protein
MAGIRDEGLFKNADDSSTAETETETEEGARLDS